MMVKLGIYAVARIYWTVYSAALPPAAVRGPLLAFGVLTATGIGSGLLSVALAVLIAALGILRTACPDGHSV